MRPMWVLVVCSAMTRVSLISVLDRPAAISRPPSGPGGELGYEGGLEHVAEPGELAEPGRRREGEQSISGYRPATQPRQRARGGIRDDDNDVSQSRWVAVPRHRTWVPVSGLATFRVSVGGRRETGEWTVSTAICPLLGYEAGTASVTQGKWG
jgi:hypothetical protein